MTDSSETWGPSTRAVHPPAFPMPSQPGLTPPVWRTAVFTFETAQDYADVLGGRSPGYTYSRLDNPTVDGFAAAVASLEDPRDGREPIAGQGFSSGMSAISTALMALVESGDHIVAPAQIYGGTYALLNDTLARFGVTTTFVDISDPSAIAQAVTSRTRVIYAETIANPMLQVADLAMLAEIAHAADAKLVVDSTFATPSVCKPLAFGADVVVHSATKYLGGHADVTAGVVVADVETLRPIAALRRTLGTTLSPDDAWLAARGAVTLQLRMERHCASASALAAALTSHPGVARVDHPSLPDSPYAALADRQFFRGMYGGIVTVSPAGGRQAGMDFCDRLKLIPIATSLGGVHSKVSHVASTTHRQFDDEALRRADIDPAAVRISVGLEDVEDLIADFLQALSR